MQDLKITSISSLPEDQQCVELSAEVAQITKLERYVLARTSTGLER